MTSFCDKVLKASTLNSSSISSADPNHAHINNTVVLPVNDEYIINRFPRLGGSREHIAMVARPQQLRYACFGILIWGTLLCTRLFFGRKPDRGNPASMAAPTCAKWPQSDASRRGRMREQFATDVIGKRPSMSAGISVNTGIRVNAGIYVGADICMHTRIMSHQSSPEFVAQKKILKVAGRRHGVRSCWGVVYPGCCVVGGEEKPHAAQPLHANLILTLHSEYPAPS
ncbi:hypothetical protein EV424DRAFT_1344405 [Suillus variegatus]|nr:hypothetical protein EV424DRAFT_1344405 [Suillus variegatus]